MLSCYQIKAYIVWLIFWQSFHLLHEHYSYFIWIHYFIWRRFIFRRVRYTCFNICSFYLWFGKKSELLNTYHTYIKQFISNYMLRTVNRWLFLIKNTFLGIRKILIATITCSSYHRISELTDYQIFLVTDQKCLYRCGEMEENSLYKHPNCDCIISWINC